jgi:hypothetical protein
MEGGDGDPPDRRSPTLSPSPRPAPTTPTPAAAGCEPGLPGSAGDTFIFLDACETRGCDGTLSEIEISHTVDCSTPEVLARTQAHAIQRAGFHCSVGDVEDAGELFLPSLVCSGNKLPRIGFDGWNAGHMRGQAGGLDQ